MILSCLVYGPTARYTSRHLRFPLFPLSPTCRSVRPRTSASRSTGRWCRDMRWRVWWSPLARTSPSSKRVTTSASAAWSAPTSPAEPASGATRTCASTRPAQPAIVHVPIAQFATPAPCASHQVPTYGGALRKDDPICPVVEGCARELHVRALRAAALHGAWL